MDRVGGDGNSGGGSSGGGSGGDHRSAGRGRGRGIWGPHPPPQPLRRPHGIVAQQTSMYITHFFTKPFFFFFSFFLFFIFIVRVSCCNLSHFVLLKRLYNKLTRCSTTCR